MAARKETEAGVQRRRILFYAENAMGWNALLPVLLRLRRHPDLKLSTIAVSCQAAEDHESWRFTSKASAKNFRDLYITTDEVEAGSWDIFVVLISPT